MWQSQAPAGAPSLGSAVPDEFGTGSWSFMGESPQTIVRCHSNLPVAPPNRGNFSDVVSGYSRGAAD
jgi:hypothetical protein